MEQYGDLFPDRPRSLDELLEESGPADGRHEQAAGLDVAGTAPRAGRLAGRCSGTSIWPSRPIASLEPGRPLPKLPWDDPALAGGEAMPLEATVGTLERLHDFEDLERSLEGNYAGASLEDVDEEALRRTLGETAAADLRRLEIERALEESGLVTRARGRIEVTPRERGSLGSER